MEMWAIYEHPNDHPLHYVARRWLVGDGDPIPGEAILATSLQAVRDALARRGFMRFLPRSIVDDPKIVETWA